MSDKEKTANVETGDAGNRISRRDLLLAGGTLGLATAAAGVTGAKAAAAAATDNAKRYQPRPGYTVPLPKNWVADHVTEDRIKQWIKEDRTDSKGSGAEK